MHRLGFENRCLQARDEITGYKDIENCSFLFFEQQEKVDIRILKHEHERN